MIKAILFDLDGVLVDSETYDQQITADFIHENNYKTDPSVFRVWIGGSPEIDSWSIILPQVHPDDDPSTFRDKVNEYHRVRRERIFFPPLAFPDTVGAIRHFHELGYKMACCSSSEPWYIERALNQLEIIDCFNFVVSGRDLTHGKPHPQIYLLTREHLGIRKDEAVVIEDSPYGIKAGKNAGILTIARKDHKFGMDQSEADGFIDSLYEIEKYL